MDFDCNCSLCFVASNSLSINLRDMYFIAFVAMCTANTSFINEGTASLAIMTAWFRQRNLVRQGLCVHVGHDLVLHMFVIVMMGVQLGPRTTCWELAVGIDFHRVV